MQRAVAGPTYRAARSECAYVITQSVESRESLANQHCFKNFKSSAAPLMLKYLQVIDETFPGYFALVSTVLVWRVGTTD